MDDVIVNNSINEVDNQEQSDENYRLYKRRWLVLTAMFSISLAVGMHRSIISIADLLDDYMQITVDQYDYATQVSIFVIMLSVFPVAMGLEYFGLRRMAYFACSMLLCANGLKIICCDNTYVSETIKNHRYMILLASEAFVGLANSVALCVPAKVASAWFANYENTLALVLAYCGYNIGVSSSNYFTPLFVKTPEDIQKLCYLFLVSGSFVTFIVLTCITRSSPKIPPSENALISANSNSIPFKKGLSMMLNQPHFILLLLTLTVNLSIASSQQLLLEDILKVQDYSNSVCGTLIAHAYLFGTFFMLIGAAWLDASPNHVRISKISAAANAIFLVMFNLSLLKPNIKSILIVTNLLSSFGTSIMYPSLFQVAIKSAMGILPEATVSALTTITQQILAVLFLNLLTGLKKITKWSNYSVPLITFSIISLNLNAMYIALYQAPKRELLRASRVDDESLVDEQARE